MNKHNLNMVWLSWHTAPRSRNIAKYLKIPLFEYYSNDGLIKRQLYSSLWTLKKLGKLQSKVIFIHYSYLLLFFVVICKMIKRKDFLVIADCHNKALRRSVNNPFSFIYEGIKKWTFRQTDITIITNKGMIPDIEKYHKNYFILPDKIPNFEVLKETKKKEKYCVFISSFAVDEPVDEIISVARNIGNDVKIYWTGKKNRNINLPKDIPTNIIFTGYLSNHDYYKLLSNADCILILTTEDNCLQCGAYEGLNANVPMVISDNKASRDYFEEAALYTKIDSQKISETIFDSLQMTSEEASLKSKIVRLKREAEFIDLIDNLILEIKSKLKL